MSELPIWEDLTTIQQWVAACEVDGAPSPDQYVDFDAPQLDASGQALGRGLRGVPIRETILRHIRVRPPFVNSARVLFAGFRGSGKTTELTRLGDDLKSVGYRVIRTDAGDYDTFTRAQSIEEMTFVLAAAIGSAADAPQLDGGSVFDRMRDLLKGFQLRDANLDFSAFNLQFAIRDNLTFRARLREAFRTRPELLRDWFHGFIGEIVAADPQRRPLVIIVDGLEKYRVPYGEIAETYRDVARMYADHASWLALPGCHVVYCVPPLLSTLERNLRDFYQVVPTMASVRIHGRPPARVPYRPGYGALREAMGRRVSLHRLFGPDWEGCADAIVAASGGHVRLMFKLLQDAIVETFGRKSYISPDDLARLFRPNEGISTRDVGSLLRHVWDGGDLMQLDDAQFSALAIALDQHMVLAYENGERWYDVAPLAEHMVGPAPADP